MSSPKELREYADECVDWARTARSDKEREIFLQMARTWTEAAERLENACTVIPTGTENQACETGIEDLGCCGSHLQSGPEAMAEGRYHPPPRAPV